MMNRNSQLTDQQVPVSFENFCIQASNANCFQMVRKGPLVTTTRRNCNTAAETTLMSNKKEIIIITNINK